MTGKKVTDITVDVLEPFLEENGYSLFHVEYVKEGKEWFLRVYIDIKGDEEKFVSIEDCEKVSRYLSEKLDVLDPVEKSYVLEVSSPGIDRPLIKDSDYEKYKGKIVDVSLYKAREGSKQLSGELLGLMDGQIIIIDEKNKQIQIPKDQASKVKLAVVF